MLVRYREYLADIKFNWEDCLFHGATVGMHTKLLFEGKSVDAATQDFHRVVNEYLSDCAKRGATPDVPYVQRRRVHIGDKLYRAMRAEAGRKNISIDELAETVLLEYFPEVKNMAVE